MRRTVLLAVVVVVAAGAAACADDEPNAAPESVAPASTTTAPSPAPAGGAVILFSPEGNNLWAYDTEPPFEAQIVVANSHDDPAGWDINGQICFFPDGSGRFVAGEDTGQPDPPPGWAIFQLSGDGIGTLGAERVGRLVPTFPPTDPEPDTFGCGILSDGRIVTTTIGNQALGPADGQLIVWFPPFDTLETSFCVVDAGLATAQQVWIDTADRVHVASARPPTSGVWRYPGPMPTGPTPDEGCGGTDAAGSPFVQAEREAFIVPSDENRLVSPNGLVGAVGGPIYVSSIVNGVISEFDADGSFVRTVLVPPDGEALADEPYSTGTPIGLALGADGALFYADLGLIRPGGDGLPFPGAGLGSVRRIVVAAGEPGAPEVVADGLTFPDNLGLGG